MMATRCESSRGQATGGCDLRKGMSVLLDVFYRADFNGDGVLTESEFKSGCCDCHMTDNDSKCLFKELSAQDSVINATDFCSFIIQHVGPFREILASLEDLTTSMCRVIDDTSEKYVKDNVRTNFVIRLLLRELLMQLAVAQSNTEGLILKIDEIEEPDKSRRGSAANSTKSVMENNIDNFIEVNKGAFENDCPSLRVLPEDTSQLLEKQVNKLELLIERLNQFPAMIKLNEFAERLHTLESLSVKFERLELILDKMEEKIEFDICEDTSDISQDNLLMVVQQKLEAEEKHYSTFKLSLDLYVQETKISEGCIYISILSYNDSSNVIIYEIWETEEKWNRHIRSSSFKTFQHQNIEHLKKPESINTIQLPGNVFASWWKKNPR